MAPEDDIRKTRLFDLADDQRVYVRCPCGASTELHPAFFPTKYKTPSDTLIWDLQYKLRCAHCRRKSGQEISILTKRFIGTSSHYPEPVIVVPFPPGVQLQNRSGE